MNLVKKEEGFEMDKFDKKTYEIIRRLQNARLSLLGKQPFYAFLLLHMKFALDLSCETAYTDGTRIAFNPDFMDQISDKELEFVLKHEVLHAALGHPFRVQSDYDLDCYDRACDIVVNSNILYSSDMDIKSITLKNFGVMMNKTPSNQDGYKFTVEEVYKELLIATQKTNKSGKDKGGAKGEGEGNNSNGEIDDHSFWKGDDEDHIGRDTWLQRMIEATDIIKEGKESKGRGIIPAAVERIIEELKNPILDWKTILNEFVQEEICDYSFAPPDKRMEESPFFLPDFNEKDESVKDILFMIDTSGSMSNDQITECYSEIYGAIGQFGGKLQGKLGFFDAVVVEPVPFEDEEEFKIIRPKGGGGTSFDVIFDYVEKEMQDEPPVSIVVLTDGYAPFPEEARANGIPVLWIINNREVKPPWGKIARIVNDAP